MKKIAVLISGTGTNLKNLAEECKNNLKGMKYSDENTVLMSESGVKYVEKL